MLARSNILLVVLPYAKRSSGSFAAARLPHRRGGGGASPAGRLLSIQHIENAVGEGGLK
jgi:hypothetical protein